jgi:hypothetical protein
VVGGVHTLILPPTAERGAPHGRTRPRGGGAGGPDSRPGQDWQQCRGQLLVCQSSSRSPCCTSVLLDLNFFWVVFQYVFLQRSRGVGQSAGITLCENECEVGVRTLPFMGFVNED